jgi:hypothetical protein
MLTPEVYIPLLSTDMRVTVCHLPAFFILLITPSHPGAHNMSVPTAGQHIIFFIIVCLHVPTTSSFVAMHSKFSLVVQYTSTKENISEFSHFFIDISLTR